MLWARRPVHTARKRRRSESAYGATSHLLISFPTYTNTNPLMPPCHTNPLLPTDLTHRTPPPHQKQAICPRTTGTTGKHTKKTRTQTRGRCRDKSPLPFCCTLGLIFFSVTCIAGVLASWADGASGRACHALKSQEDLAGSRVMYLLLCFLASN